MLARAFQDKGQEENNEFKELALYLASEFFMEHASKDVKLLVACCIADIFRIFAPEAPYADGDQLKVGASKIYPTLLIYLYNFCPLLFHRITMVAMYKVQTINPFYLLSASAETHCFAPSSALTLVQLLVFTSVMLHFLQQF